RADQGHKNLVQGRIALVEAAQADSLGEAGLQNRVRVGRFAQFQVPPMGAIYARFTIVLLHTVKRGYVSQLPERRNVILRLDADAARQKTPGLRNCAVEYFPAAGNQQDAVTKPLGM